MKRNIMTLISDFGNRDGYIGSLKGLILSDVCDIELVNISQDISPFNVGEAAFCLFSSHSWFPLGTVHVVIVDPGVGSDRNILFLQANGQVFIGPDNGVFDPIVYLYGDHKCYAINISKFKNVGSTFHGRDVFIPAGIKYLNGEEILEFCQPHNYQFHILSEEMMAGLTATVLHTDHFGNVITALNKVKIGERKIRSLNFEQIEIPFVNYYEEGELGKPICLFGSSGLLEIAVCHGNAKEYFIKRWSGVPASFDINWN